jgi:annexin-like protein
MQVNNQSHGSFFSGVGGTRQQRMDFVQTTLDNRGVHLGQATPTQLAANRSFGAQMMSDIGMLQGMGGMPMPCCGGGMGMGYGMGGSGMGMMMPGFEMQGFEQLMHSHQNQVMMLMYMQQMNEMMMMMYMMILQQMMQGQGQGQGQGQMPPHADCPSIPEAPVQPAPEPGHPEHPGGPGGPERPREPNPREERQPMTAARAARVLLDNIDLLDTAAGQGERDSIIGLNDLRAAASNNPGLPAELKEAIAFVLENEAVLNALDVAAGQGTKDNLIGRNDLEAFLRRNERPEQGSDDPAVRPPADDDDSPPAVRPDRPRPEPSPEPKAPTPPEPAPPDPRQVQLRLEAQANATRIHEAVDGGGTDENALIQVLSRLNNEQLQALRTAYQEMYGRDLTAVVDSETSGDFGSAIVGLTRSRPDENEPVARAVLQSDARALHRAMRGMGTDETTLIEILTSRSRNHLNQLKQVYQQSYNQSLSDRVRGETSGDLQRTLLAVLS